MAPSRRRSDSSVIGALADRPRRFSFVQAVRLLEREAACRAGEPRLARRTAVGGDHDPRGEAVRFHAVVNLAFPDTEVQGLRRSEDGRTHLEVNFFGLTGPLGALPEGYSELVQRGLREKRPELREFLDIFNHRLVSLFYRAWAKYRLAPSYERAVAEGRPDGISTVLTALVGLEGEAMRARMTIPDDVALHYGGALARRIRPAVVVEDMLSGALGLQVRVEQFRGQWCPLSEPEQSILPSPARPDGQFCRLGVAMVAGNRAWEVHGGLRLHIGPLGYDDFLALMPGSAGTARLADLVALAVGLQMDIDLRLLQRAEEVPPLCLGGSGPPARLGWNTWLGGGERRGCREVTFRP